MKTKRTTQFNCSECGYENAKWLGKCPACGEWNTFVETPIQDVVAVSKLSRQSNGIRESRVFSLTEVDAQKEVRDSTKIQEFDRVLGGGIVGGSVILFSGEPGIGKSTLMMQVCANMIDTKRILYVSGEESLHQLKLRGDRLGMTDMRVLSETSLEDVLAAVVLENPHILIIDSIQTMYTESLNSAPGSVAQVKSCALEFIKLAKKENITVFLIGHVNKEGSVAGPKVLEHMVDCVLQFEGDRHHIYRILRSEKNRFGSTQEIGVFEMVSEGLKEVPSPSEILLSGRPTHVPGSCVACVMEGSRPVLAEVQALLTTTTFGNPRRTVSGLDYNRSMLLLAVLEKRGGLYAGNQDCYLNIIGGLRLGEPSSDLPVLLSMASSLKDKPISHKVVAFGEVGLTGEVRGVSGISQRLHEASRLGFTHAIVPAQGTSKIQAPEGMTLCRVKTIRDAMVVSLGIEAESERRQAEN